MVAEATVAADAVEQAGERAVIDLTDAGPAGGTSDRTPGVAMFLPAFNEEAVIAETVAEALDVLEDLDIDHVLVLVDDGSVDQTGAIALDLQSMYGPRRLRVHRHPSNRGYGAALRTGFQAAVDSGFEWAFFCDADGQFDVSQLRAFLAVADAVQADAVVGYRAERADPLVRRVNAKLWGWLSEALVDHQVKDVDCAFKLVRCSLLSQIELVGDAATISPELLAKARRAGATVIELPVRHLPRRAGQQSGARLSVVVRSLVGLVRLRRELRPGRA